MVFKAFIMKIKSGKRDEISSKDIFIVKFMFSKKATKNDKFSPSIWRYVVNVKSTVKISSIFVAFLENMNFMASCH